MFKSLSIQNYAIIETLNIDFEQGFSVITGETGAGKSIILGAMALVLGQRADAKSLREGAGKCIIEAVFDISEYSLQAFFAENDLDYDSRCSLRREILPNGKSRAFINDTPATLAQLKELGEQLIDIHSQHENLLLKDNSFQLNVLDIVAHNEHERQDYQSLYQQFKKTESALLDLTEKNAKAADNREYLHYQLEQLQRVNLKQNEKEELEEEQKLLTHTEEIKVELEKITQLLSDERLGLLSSLKEAQLSARRLTAFLPVAEEYTERIGSAYLDLQDLASELEAQQNDTEYDPQRADFINQRLDLIYSLEQKHRLSGEKTLLDLQSEMEKELESIDNADGEIEILKNELDRIQTELARAARQLTTTRETAKAIVIEQLLQTLRQLNMPHIRFDISIRETDNFCISGKDKVEFLFSANEKMPLQAIAQIASGGEISRVMLALKSIMATAQAMPAIIFDEIDTGVSGETAGKMAEIMHAMSEMMQVICITHLPQIAAKGSMHYQVYKSRSATNIRRLATHERVNEIAQMLSGASLSQAAVDNAKALLGV